MSKHLTIEKKYCIIYIVSKIIFLIGLSRMLKDRRALVEDSIRQKQEVASKLYLDIIRMQNLGIEKNIYSNKIKEIDSLRENIANLQFDLLMINDLINQGHE